MKFEEIRELVKLMDEYHLTEVKVENGENHIYLRRGEEMVAVPAAPVAVAAVPAPAAPVAPNHTVQYCPACGTKLPAAAKFCSGCGTKLD